MCLSYLERDFETTCRKMRSIADCPFHDVHPNIYHLDDGLINEWLKCKKVFAIYSTKPYFMFHPAFRKIHPWRNWKKKIKRLQVSTFTKKYGVSRKNGKKKTRPTNKKKRWLALHAKKIQPFPPPSVFVTTKKQIQIPAKLEPNSTHRKGCSLSVSPCFPKCLFFVFFKLFLQGGLPRLGEVNTGPG